MEKRKKYLALAGLAAVAMLFAVPIASAQYDGPITSLTRQMAYVVDQIQGMVGALQTDVGTMGEDIDAMGTTVSGIDTKIDDLAASQDGWLHTTEEAYDTVYLDPGGGEFLTFDTRGYRAITVVIVADMEFEVYVEWVLGSAPNEMFAFEEWFECTGPFPGTDRTYDVRGPTLQLLILAPGDGGDVRVRLYMTT